MLEQQKAMADFFLEGMEDLKLTSQSFTVYDVKLQRILYQKEGNCTREMASLTKIMTCHIICKYIQKGLISQNQEVQVSKLAASMIGTSAELQQGDKLKVIDLLYGLMLPSGNDAAHTLAEFMGKILFKKTEIYKRRKYDNVKGNICTNKDGYRCFINEMNKTARNFNLNKTQYANPHGLSHRFNRSCSNDLAKLSNIAMLQSELFRNIVLQKTYTCQIKQKNMEIRESTWQNTNKLILDNKYGCIGIKTGITPWAGPCMSTSFKYQNRHLIIIILRADHIEQRFSESSKILKWTIEKYNQYDLRKQSQEIENNNKNNKIVEDEVYSILSSKNSIKQDQDDINTLQNQHNNTSFADSQENLEIYDNQESIEEDMEEQNNENEDENLSNNSNNIYSNNSNNNMVEQYNNINQKSHKSSEDTSKYSQTTTFSQQIQQYQLQDSISQLEEQLDSKKQQQKIDSQTNFQLQQQQDKINENFEKARQFSQFNQLQH